MSYHIFLFNLHHNSIFYHCFQFTNEQIVRNSYLKFPAFPAVLGLGQLHNDHLQIVRGKCFDIVIELQKDDRKSSQVMLSQTEISFSSLFIWSCWSFFWPWDNEIFFPKCTLKVNWVHFFFFLVGKVYKGRDKPFQPLELFGHHSCPGQLRPTMLWDSCWE